MSQDDLRSETLADYARTTGFPAPNIRKEFLDLLVEYARARPGVAALWCFGLGFIVGWKLKPW